MPANREREIRQNRSTAWPAKGTVVRRGGHGGIGEANASQTIVLQTNLALMVSFCCQTCGALLGKQPAHLSIEAGHYFTSSISPGFQVLSNHGSRGP
jgi:hypothetical protein